MATVNLAHNEGHDRRVAVKVLSVRIPAIEALPVLGHVPLTFDDFVAVWAAS